MKKLRVFPRLDPRLAAELKNQRRPILLGLTCTSVASALAGSPIALVNIAGDAVETLSKQAGRPETVAAHQAMAVLFWSCLAVPALFGLKYWFTRGQTYFLSMAANRLAANLRARLMDKLMRLPVSYFNDRRTGAIQSVLTNDVNVYQNAVGIVRDSIDGPVKVVVALVSVFVIQPWLGSVAILMIPAMAALIQANSRRMKRAQAQVQEDLAELSATTQEVLLGSRIVKAFGAEDRVSAQYGDLVERSFQSQMRAVATVAALRPLVELIGAVALAVIIYTGGILAAHGELRVSNLLALALAMDMMNQGFRSLGNIGNTYAAVQAASARIYAQILDVPATMQDQDAALRLENPVGRVEFCDVSFAYPDGTEALRNVSFVLEPGTSLALVGPSGAGKTTIADLVLRFYDPTGGKILFDGVDLRELSPSWLRAQIGVVPQHTFLFAGSIESNVRMGAPEASDEDVAEALRRAHAEQFTREMTERVDGALGERGVKLSGGQMQRVAIARALVRKPTLLVLDEATSALDATSEKIVTQALDEVMHSRTTLFIAHRLTTAARADRILYLRRGEVVEQGSHRELMERNGEYAALFRIFSSGVIEEIS